MVARAILEPSARRDAEDIDGQRAILDSFNLQKNKRNQDRLGYVVKEPRMVTEERLNNAGKHLRRNNGEPSSSGPASKAKDPKTMQEQGHGSKVETSNKNGKRPERAQEKAQAKNSEGPAHDLAWKKNPSDLMEDENAKDMILFILQPMISDVANVLSHLRRESSGRVRSRDLMDLHKHMVLDDKEYPKVANAWKVQKEKRDEVRRGFKWNVGAIDQAIHHGFSLKPSKEGLLMRR